MMLGCLHWLSRATACACMHMYAHLPAGRSVCAQVLHLARCTVSKSPCCRCLAPDCTLLRVQAAGGLPGEKCNAELFRLRAAEICRAATAALCLTAPCCVCRPPAVYLARNAMLSSFACGRQTSLVVDAGHAATVGEHCKSDVCQCRFNGPYQLSCVA